MSEPTIIDSIDPSARISMLSQAERKVLGLSGKGMTSREIAEEVGIEQVRVDLMLVDIRVRLGGSDTEALQQLAALIHREHTIVVSAGAAMAVHALAVGQVLLAAKKQVPAGEWQRWVRENFPNWSASTSALYIRLAAERDVVLAGKPATLGEAKRLLAQRGRVDHAIEVLLFPHQQARPLLEAPPRANEELSSEEGDLTGRIRESLAGMNNSQQAIADFVLDHLDDVAFATAEEMAKQVGTSSSSIVRFTQALGFDGFPEFQQAVRDEYRSRRVAPPVPVAPPAPPQRSRPASPAPPRPRATAEPAIAQAANLVARAETVIAGAIQYGVTPAQKIALEQATARLQAAQEDIADALRAA